MFWIIRPSLLGLAAACLLAACTAQPHQMPPKTAAKPPENPHWASLLASYDRFFSDSMAATNTPGAAVVIVRDSQVVFCKGYGLRANGQPDSVDAHTVFRVGSLSKGFASVLTAVLIKEGALQWEDPVVRYYNHFSLCDSEQTQRVKITHLLSHCSGLPYHTFTNMIEGGYDIPTIVDYFKKVKLCGKEGELYCYQNAAYSVIEEVMRGATGKSYQELLPLKIFQPAGMASASVTYDRLVNNPNKALPHSLTGAGWVDSAISERYYNAAAAGGVNASIADMGQWLLLLNGQKPAILTDAMLDFVFRPRIRTYDERRHFGEWSKPKTAYYALGWRVLTQETDTLVYHGGYVNGFRGEIAIDRKNKVAICVLFNAATELSQRCIPAFFKRYRSQKAEIEAWEQSRAISVSGAQGR